MQTPRFWREIDERYALKGVKCGSCGSVIFPSRTLCPQCRHASVGKLSPFKLGSDGVVEAVTVVRSPPAGIDGPYTLALIRMDEGPRLTAQAYECELSVHTGQELRGRKRLDQVVVCPGPQRLHAGPVARSGGEQNHRGGAQLGIGAHGLEQREAV